MDITIENEYLKVTAKQKGAELCNVVNKETYLEYMWGADPAFWGKTSPVLFPIVGTLVEDEYSYRGKKYAITRHGFARDETFEIEKKEKNRAVFLLKSSEASLKKYPFPFELRLKYELIDQFLHVSYDVRNAGNEEMYFSIGAHPAFKVPLVDKTKYQDYYLEFNKHEDGYHWPITPGGLIVNEPVSFFNHTNLIKLHKELFYDGALVFKQLISDRVSLKSRTHPHGLDFYFEGFPFMAIWAAKDADFVCIEPWCGIADSVSHNQQLISKEGIEKAAPGEQWNRTWKVKFY